MRPADKTNPINRNRTIRVGDRLVDFATPRVMGIINLTPDSFYAGSRKMDFSEILKTAETMLTEGATFLDVGGYSSRPGAEHISAEEELQRVIGPVQGLRKEFPDAIISVDTFRSQVAKAAVESGAHIINDISAGRLDENMLATMGELGVPFIAMHMKGTPQDMAQHAQYDDIVLEVVQYFSGVLHRARQAGICDVLIDPGFGFAKTAEQNFHMLNHLSRFHDLECPLVVGVSRKSMVYKTLNSTAEEALNGTTVLNTLTLLGGASVLRVHDVKAAMEAIKLTTHLT
jgi:dihydropteroate synthase